MIFGSFKLPEEAPRLTGFKKPRLSTTWNTPPSPEAPINLCKDGFDGTECVPGGKSVFVPRNRHRDISGLGILALGKPMFTPSQNLDRLTPSLLAESYMSTTRKPPDGETNRFNAGAECGSQRESRSRELGEATLPIETVEHDLLARVDQAEAGTKGVLVCQTPERRVCTPRTSPSNRENRPVPETPVRDQTFDAPSVLTGSGAVDGTGGEQLAAAKIPMELSISIRRNTTRGEGDYGCPQRAGLVFIPSKGLGRALSARLPTTRLFNPELY